MYRTHTCGELNMSHVGQKVSLAGWLAVARDFGGLTFIDLRDRYGITQIVFDVEHNDVLGAKAQALGREFVIQITGEVRERSNKNNKIPTGEIEIWVDELNVLNEAKTPPFTILEDTDGGDDLRMKFRYLDLRRPNIQKQLFFRSKLAIEARKYLADQQFIEVETPVLIKSTPEGARDFVVPSRMNEGEFYALPQSPQTFKQLLMVSGFDRYFQLVKCFRDEDLRADRQPEFTQIDCEMSFVNQEDILQTFEGLTKYLFQQTLDVHLDDFPRMTYDEAMEHYGSDKPDIRFDMKLQDLSSIVKGKGFGLFDDSESIIGICVKGAAGDYSNKQIKELTEWVKRPQIGAGGLVYVKYEAEGTRSSVGKFYSDEDLAQWAANTGAEVGDLLLVLCGEIENTRKQLGELRLEMGRRQGLMDPTVFAPLWVLDFPLLEWDEDSQRFHAMHHPFTAPKKEYIATMMTADFETLKAIKADAYDLVLNGNEIGGGSIRIHDRELQAKNFNLLGFTPEEAEQQFGFLMQAFQYGAPPHGGIAFGFDRLCSVMLGQQSIRDVIAFPKNNSGRDVMIDAPATVDQEQLKELHLKLDLSGEKG